MASEARELEENLLLPPPQASVISNFILSIYGYTHM